jgi:hypothetical protein
MPGVLPVPNDEALRLTVLTGFLLNCEIPRHIGWGNRTTSWIWFSTGRAFPAR